MNTPCASIGALAPARRLRFATSLFVLLVSTIAAHGQPGRGSIGGSITSAETRNALQGAVVAVPALNQSGLTDNSGAFLLENLPPGPHELVISYTGFNEERRSVTVRPGEFTRADTTLQPTETIQMQAFTVATEREGAALSITEQRNAANIKNVTALDEWGNLPTLSIAELAMRLPGISFTTDEDNVVNNVSIRGMAPGFTRLNIDGMSSTGVGGDGRSATLHSFSGAMYEQIEIIAGQTPDKRADGLGGQLNLKTRSPLSMSEKRRFNYNVSARWSPPFAERTQQRSDHPMHPVFSLNYQEVFSVLGGSRNLGIALNTSYTEGVNMIATDILLYQSTTDPVAFFNNYQSITGLNHRFITGLSLRADYRLSPRSKVSLSLIYNSGSEPFYDRTRVNARSAATVATVLPNGELSATGAIVPGYTANRTEIRRIAGSWMDLDVWQFSFTSKNPTGTIAAEHNFGRLKLDYAARWSNTHWHSAARPDQSGGQLTMRTELIGFVLDRSNLAGQVFTQVSGPDVYDPASYTSNIVHTKRDTVTDTNEVSGTFNASYLLPIEMPITLKTGVDTVNRRVNNRQVNTRRWTRTAGAPPLTGALMPVSRFEEQHGGRLPTFAPVSFNDQLSNASLWTENFTYAATSPYTNRRIMEEAVDAGYFQATARIMPGLNVLAGVRVEHVEVDTFTYARYRTTPVAVEPDPFRRAALDFGAATSTGSYTKAFPSVHFSYDITPRFKARASWSMSYGRPTLAQLVPAITANETRMTVTAGNPSLKPQLARNIDLKLEYYFKQTGLASIGYFQKKITDYIINRVGDLVPNGPDNGFEGNYGGFLLTTPINAGDAEVNGWEADFRQRLTFLPGLWKGLTVAGNFTYLETQGRFTGTTVRRTNQVVGFVPRAANARVVYNYKRFAASAVMNFTGEHILGFSATAAANNFYRRDLRTVNLGASYKFLTGRPEATVYMDVNNVFEQGPSQYRFIDSRTRLQVMGTMTINVGVSGQF